MHDVDAAGSCMHDVDAAGSCMHDVDAAGRCVHDVDVVCGISCCILTHRHFICSAK